MQPTAGSTHSNSAHAAHTQRRARAVWSARVLVEHILCVACARVLVDLRAGLDGVRYV